MTAIITSYSNSHSPVSPYLDGGDILRITVFVVGLLAAGASTLGFLRIGMYSQLGIAASATLAGGAGVLCVGAYVTRPEPTVEFELTQTERAPTSFQTHSSVHAERLHAVEEFILLPARAHAQLLAYTLQPAPGEHKEKTARSVAIKIASFALWLITLPFALVSFALAYPLRCIDNQFRPRVSFYHFDKGQGKNSDALVLTQDSPLHVRTHNLGFTPTTMSITGDLRDPMQRARELVEGIVGDPHAPDIIFFQETFHENATRLLCEGIQSKYPYIAHSTHPSTSGFNSGGLIASKYPIESVRFHQLDHNLWPETLSPKGIIQAKVKASQGRTLLLYGVHTQAILGEDRAKARFLQLQELHEFMQDDLRRHPGALQVVIGDFNISTVTAWGEDNYNRQAEKAGIDRLNALFDDLYLRDHEATKGARTQPRLNSLPNCLDADNARMDNVPRPEPTGSWFQGPFADPGLLLSWKMRFERWWHNHPVPAQVVAATKTTWGRPQWYAEQTANTARFDYILIPQSNKLLDGRVEIRRPYVPSGTQSSCSDHLPTDGFLWAR